MVEELLSYTLSDIEDLDKLMHVLSETSFCNEAILRDGINDENTHVFVVRVRRTYRRDCNSLCFAYA